MKISTKQHMSLLAQKLDCFGLFELSYLMIDSTNHTQMLSSLNYRSDGDCFFSFSDRFFHFLKIIPENSSKFYSEKTDLFKQSPFLQPIYYVAFIKKTCSKKIKIYLFHSTNRSDVIHLLLHKEVVKRMSLYLDECLSIKKMSMSPEDFSKLFKDDAMPNTLCGLKKDYIEEALDILLTKKEKKLVSIFLQCRSVSTVTEKVGFSRSYVNQLLLSSAHKLGLIRVHDILTIDTTHDVLLHKLEKQTLLSDTL